MPEKPLNTWKQIAAHLGVSISTAQRLQKEGLPVLRPGKAKRGPKSSVYTFPSELDAWIRGRQKKAKQEDSAGSELSPLSPVLLSRLQKRIGPHPLYVLTWSPLQLLLRDRCGFRGRLRASKI